MASWRLGWKNPLCLLNETLPTSHEHIYVEIKTCHQKWKWPQHPRSSSRDQDPLGKSDEKKSTNFWMDWERFPVTSKSSTSRTSEWFPIHNIMTGRRDKNICTVASKSSKLIIHGSTPFGIFKSLRIGSRIKGCRKRMFGDYFWVIFLNLFFLFVKKKAIIIYHLAKAR